MKLQEVNMADMPITAARSVEIAKVVDSILIGIKRISLGRRRSKGGCAAVEWRCKSYCSPFLLCSTNQRTKVSYDDC